MRLILPYRRIVFCIVIVAVAIDNRYAFVYTEYMEGTFAEHKNIYSRITYHFLFSPRYRRKIFSDNAVSRRFISLTKDICKEMGVKILNIRCRDDHVYLVVSAIPELSPHRIIRTVKTDTSSALRNEFKSLSSMTSLWTRAYMVSTEEIQKEEIDGFLEKQKTRL